MQATLTRRLPGSFRPYSLEQIHGTLIILSGRADDQVPGAVIGQYYLEHRGERRVIDFERALQILQARLAQPIRIRVGGFGPSDPGPFTSQGRPLAERSFSARGDALVLMGWPVSSLASGGRAQPLDALRREMAEAGVLHKYHVRPADVDNDFHLVVGHYAGRACGGGRGGGRRRAGGPRRAERGVRCRAGPGPDPGHRLDRPGRAVVQLGAAGRCRPDRAAVRLTRRLIAEWCSRSASGS